MSTPADPASLGRSAHGRDGQGPTAIHYPTSARQPQDDGAAFYADVLDDHPLTPDPNHPIDGAASTRFVTPPAEPLPDLPTTAAYDLHSISSEPEDAYARSVVTDGMSVTSHSRLRPATADTSRGGPRTLVDPPPVPRVHIDPSRPHPQRLPTGQRTTSSPNFRQTLSEKVMQSGYSTPPPLSRGSTNDYLSAGGNGPYKSLSAQSSSTNLVFADGDFPAPRGVFAKVMLALFTSNIIIRWFFFITPLLAILWIPGIIGVTASKDATVWGVKLIWWSAWLSVFWGGWWIGLAFAKLAPPILHYVVGTILPMLDPWFGYLSNMKKSITAFIWSLLSWILFNALILSHKQSDITAADSHTLHVVTQGLVGILLSCAILVIEKLVIQIIAAGFHRKSYEDRILEQQTSILALTRLYVNSHDLGRKDTLDGQAMIKDPTHLLKSASKGVRNFAQAGTTIFGIVASEIAGERILQPNAPDSTVTHALSSSNKSRQLARRIFFSFCLPGSNALLVDDIARCFPTREAAEAAFKLFDRDENGDLTLEEMEMSVLELHRDRLALANSMRDLDSAVGKLDDILLFLWYIVSILIIVALLNTSFQGMLASAGALVLGLSWLIGSTAQETLASIIFLFVKHPYDVSDRVDIDGSSYVVKEIHLLFTVFRQTDGKIAQIPHSVLATKTVINIRRSGAISEAFTWNVDFGTTFEKIEALRHRLLEFLEAERRDFLPSIDISISDFEDQAKLTLKCDIKYKSNWQNGTQKSQRRNAFICAMKLALAELEIYGPAGAGNPSPPPDPKLIKLVSDNNDSLPGSASSIGGEGVGRTSSLRKPGASSTSPVDKPVSPTSTGHADAALIDRLRLGGGSDAVLRDAQSDIFFEKGVRRKLEPEQGPPGSSKRRTASLSLTSNVAQVAAARKHARMQAAQAAKSEKGGGGGKDDVEMQMRQA